MGGRGRWCDHLPPATAVVDCEGEEHRVTWRRGKVVLEHHDLGSERAMVMLGGAPCACLTVLDRWTNLFSWATSPDMFQQMDARLGRWNFAAPGELRDPQELALLLTWQRAWRRVSYLGDHERLLLGELRARALPLLKDHLALWRERVGSRLMSAADVKVARGDEGCRLEGSLDRVRGTVTAHLDAVWVVRVWVRGLATVDDAFVLEVLEDDAASGEVAVRAARWEESSPGWGRYAPVVRHARLRPDGQGPWSVSWEGRAEAGVPAAVSPLPSLDDLLDRGFVPRSGKG